MLIYFSSWIPCDAGPCWRPVTCTTSMHLCSIKTGPIRNNGWHVSAFNHSCFSLPIYFTCSRFEKWRPVQKNEKEEKKTFMLKRQTLSLTSKVTIYIFYKQLSQIAAAWGFPLVVFLGFRRKSQQSQWATRPEVGWWNRNGEWEDCKLILEELKKSELYLLWWGKIICKGMKNRRHHIAPALLTSFLPNRDNKGLMDFFLSTVECETVKLAVVQWSPGSNGNHSALWNTHLNLRSCSLTRCIL